MRNKDPTLRYTWTIWEQIMEAPKTDAKVDPKTTQYSDNTHRVASFGTVKSFWKYWNHLPQPSELLAGKKFVRETASGRSVVDALMIFRDGIKPEWEDAVNTTGGHFQYALKPQLKGGVIDEYWNNLVLGMIGSTIEPADMITGVRLVDRLNNKSAAIRLEVWFANYDDEKNVDLLQNNLEKCMTTRLDGTHSQAANLKVTKHPHKSHGKK